MSIMAKIDDNGNCPECGRDMTLHYDIETIDPAVDVMAAPTEAVWMLHNRSGNWICATPPGTSDVADEDFDALTDLLANGGVYTYRGKTWRFNDYSAVQRRATSQVEWML